VIDSLFVEYLLLPTVVQRRLNGSTQFPDVFIWILQALVMKGFLSASHRTVNCESDSSVNDSV